MGRKASARVGLALSLLALGALAPAAGCGSSESENPGDESAHGGRSDTGSAGEGGETSTGGDGSDGGSDGVQGGSGGDTTPSTGGFAGRASGGSGSAGGPLGTGGGFGGSMGGFGGAGEGGTGGSIGTSGGAPGCIEGVPCKCKKLSGTTKCNADTSTCECPAASECALAPSSCFEPCGGEPFGTWVLEETCFGAGDVGNGCSGGLIRGTSGTMDLRLRILDGGSLEIVGEEVWDILATVPLECLGIQSVNSCPNTFFFAPQPLLFAFGTTSACSANACGVCDCAAKISSAVTNSTAWSRDEENRLRLGVTDVPYCAEDDTLWIGGAGSNGAGKVAYKFKKQSCMGTPVPCAERDAEACVDGCFQGGCVRTTGTAPGCERAVSAAECRVLQGCSWDPDICSGTTYESCTFENCDKVPGCSFGPPVARCGGTPIPCEQRDMTQCKSDGCSLAKCYSFIGQDTVSCTTLSTNECAKATGCTVVDGTCSGTTRCSTQTDVNVCSSLDSCTFEPQCVGTPPLCSTLAVDACQGALGCRIEW